MMTLSQAVLPNADQGLMRKVILAVVGSAILAISAKLKVDIGLVPLTMQSLAVLAIGAAFGARLGMATVALYLFEGAVGLPVFANGGGLIYLAGPTAGYLFAYVLAAGLVGFLAEKGWDRSVFSMAAAMTLGTAVILAGGFLWAATGGLALGLFEAKDLGTLWTYWVQPFLIGDAIKVVIAALSFPAIWKLMQKF